jgi:ATPase family associated with various cellular activities (AAA)
MQETHRLVLAKLSERQLQEKVIDKNIDAMLASVNNKNLFNNGWTVVRDTDDHPKGWSVIDHDGNGHARSNVKYKFFYYVKINFDHPDKKMDKNVLGALCKNVNTRSAQPALGRWVLETVDGQEYIPPEEGTAYSADMVGYADVEIPDDWLDSFGHLFGVEFKVEMLFDAVQAACDSNFNNRFHAVLYGPPGCGKSDVCQTFKRVLGDDAVMEYDATATTGAGAIKDLAEREILPRFMIVEEIEKGDDKGQDFLLAMMDMRAEIRKVTARATIERSTRLFVIATVNNMELFKSRKAGALASRFATKIKFNRPSREQLEMILQREIAKINGDFAWIEPCLDYCDKQRITDPRQVIALCLTGKDKWISGRFAQMLADTSDFTGEIDDWTM